MSDNLELYKQHSRPPEWALKTIEGGRIKGFTDINPQWRIQALTESFGVVGFGWRYTVDRLEFVTASNGEVAVFASISLYVKKDDKWSDAILGTGGSMFVSLEKSGLKTSDEAEKMAITDAVSVACKLMGIGGSIYSGSKYNEIYKQKEPKEKPPLSDKRMDRVIERIKSGEVGVLENLSNHFTVTEEQLSILKSKVPKN